MTSINGVGGGAGHRRNQSSMPAIDADQLEGPPRLPPSGLGLQTNGNSREKRRDSSPSARENVSRVSDSSPERSHAYRINVQQVSEAGQTAVNANVDESAVENRPFMSENMVALKEILTKCIEQAQGRYVNAN